eukprot:2094376-Rhodomonas_salina.1
MQEEYGDHDIFKTTYNPAPQQAPPTYKICEPRVTNPAPPPAPLTYAPVVPPSGFRHLLDASW